MNALWFTCAAGVNSLIMGMLLFGMVAAGHWTPDYQRGRTMALVLGFWFALSGLLAISNWWQS